MKTPRDLLLQKHAAAAQRATFTPPTRSRIVAFNWNILALAALWITILFLKLDSPTIPMAVQPLNTPPANPIASIELRRAEILKMLNSIEASEVTDPLKAAWIRRESYLV